MCADVVELELGSPSDSLVSNASVTIGGSETALPLGASDGALLAIGDKSEVSSSAANKWAITDGSRSTCSDAEPSTGSTDTNDTESTGGDMGVVVASTVSVGGVFNVGNIGDSIMFVSGDGGRDAISGGVKSVIV